MDSYPDHDLASASARRGALKCPRAMSTADLWPSEGPSSRPATSTRPPLTASRPPPSRAQTSHSTAKRPRTSATTRIDDDTSEWIVAIIESRSTGREVGIAACDRASARVVLTQLSDSQTYVKTLHSLNQRPPVTLLVPQSAIEPSTKLGPRAPPGSKPEPTILVQCLQDGFEDVQMIGVKRAFWNAEEGRARVEKLAIEDEKKQATVHAAGSKYYALSACAALFEYLEKSCQVCYGANTVHLQYIALEGTMLIDTETAKHLELVANVRDRKSKHSLYGLLNACVTPMAMRLLRVNILAPLTDERTISDRLDAVQELVEQEHLPRAIIEALAPLKGTDYDKLIGAIVSPSNKTYGAQNPAVEAERKLEELLLLRKLVRAIPSIRSSLTGCHADLLVQIKDILGDPRPEVMREVIDSTINEDAMQGLQKGAFAAKNTKAYAVRASEKRMLDVSRAAYEENVRDAEALCSKLAEEHGLDMSLKWTSGGFTFVVKRDEVEMQALPKIFINRAVKAKLIHLSSLDLAKTNQRLQASLEEIFILSDQVLDDVLDDIRRDVASLFHVCEAIAMLDMLNSLAKVSYSQNYVRPEFCDTLAIKNGRHPIQERFRFTQGETFQPNDTYASSSALFQIITGANGSGKSTLIRQIALLNVMAQIGSFVPADYASFVVQDALFSRLSNDDSIEANLSTFSKEMSTMSAILSALSSFERVLVIVDELGRGTSPEEGVGIAHAIAEELIKAKAICFFATHFRELAETLSVHPIVVSLHLQSEIRDKSGPRLRHSHRVLDGTSKLPHYGLALANAASLPPDMLHTARKVTRKLDELVRGQKRDAAGERLRERRRILAEIDATLGEALRSPLDNDALCAYLKNIHLDALRAVVGTLDARPSTAGSVAPVPPLDTAAAS